MDNFQLLLHEPEDGVLLLAVTGEVDLATAPRLRESTRAAIDSGNYRCLVFDLTQLEFIDSSGLHVLVDSQRRMAAAGGAVRVVNTSRGIGKVLELTGLERLLGVVPDRQTAFELVA